MRRREFVTLAAAAIAAEAKTLSRRERVDRPPQGKDVDRTPFTFWHHFGLKTPEEHVKATLDFHAKYRTDIVKVMSDFPYPQPAGLSTLSWPLPEITGATSRMAPPLPPL